MDTYQKKISEKNDSFKMTQRLNTIIDSASSWHDVKPLLEKIPLNELKVGLHQMINNQQNKIDIQAIYWGFMRTIENILPGDLIQYILAFLAFDLQFVKVVNKRWKRLSQINERICYSQLSKQNTNIAYNEEINTTYIIRYPRIQLTAIEREMSFKMIPHSKRKQVGKDDIVVNMNIINNMLKDGDRIFVFSGSYVIEKPIIFNTNITIIGIRGSGKYQYFLERPNIIYWPKQFEQNTPAITVNGCTLSINNCKVSTITDDPIIQINKHASLFVNNNSTIYCYLGQLPNMNAAAIMIRIGAIKIHISDSIIRGFKHCIALITQSQRMIKKFICQNNTFINIQSYPIITTRDHDIESEQNYDKNIYQIHNNKLDYIKWSHHQTQHDHQNEKYVNKIKFVSQTHFDIF